MNRRLYAAYTEALEELAVKSLADIQEETALKWAGRALAAEAGSVDAHEYAHEAIEHAALTGDFELLAQIREAFDEAGVEF